MCCVWKDSLETLKSNHFISFTQHLTLISRGKWFTPEEKATGFVTVTDNFKKKKKVVNVNMAVAGIF